MRSFTATLCLALVLLAASGCGSSEPKRPTLTISFQGATTGPLAHRSADMQKAASLAIEAIHRKVATFQIKVVTNADRDSIAVIGALGSQTQQAAGQLLVSLRPPVKFVTRDSRPDDLERLAPQILLPPADERARAALASYKASGSTGAAGAAVDSPEKAGTPSGQYVTAALSQHNYPPAGSKFFEKFNEKYGRAPDRWAIYGYEAVGLIVDAIARLDKLGLRIDQQSVAQQALRIRNRFGPVGHYDILPSGQTTLYVFQSRGAGAPDGPASLIEAQR